MKTQLSNSDWTKVFDPTYKRCYYFNKKTKESTWENPHSRNGDSGSKLKLPQQGSGKWLQCFDKQLERTYFYNSETGESTWTCPPELKSKETTEGDVKETRSIQGSDLVTTNTVNINGGEYHLGSVVKIKDVRSNPLLNGMVGPVVAISDRFKVMIGGKTLSFRKENVELCEPFTGKRADFRMNRGFRRTNGYPLQEVDHSLEMEFIQTYKIVEEIREIDVAESKTDTLVEKASECSLNSKQNQNLESEEISLLEAKQEAEGSTNQREINHKKAVNEAAKEIAEPVLASEMQTQSGPDVESDFKQLDSVIVENQGRGKGKDIDEGISEVNQAERKRDESATVDKDACKDEADEIGDGNQGITIRTEIGETEVKLDTDESQLDGDNEGVEGIAKTSEDVEGEEQEESVLEESNDDTDAAKGRLWGDGHIGSWAINFHKGVNAGDYDTNDQESSAKDILES
mmetsp:Transcript_4995/g.6652  ORF Transcript_4995/g.6652 Transcript_4995/m.6652 type:complete len:459 (+) Transcript_4995:128-1504(+)